ncbi:MAG: hypothetical protein J1E61_07895 [Lachnospiraceae bacterium]|nr:hypothetical protein [Lachnospiraceae bacterium]
MEKWKGICEKIGKDRFIILIIGGLLLLVITYPLPSGADKDGQRAAGAAQGSASVTSTSLQNNMGSSSDYETRLEKRLEKVLSAIDGAGNVKVFITLSDYGRYVVEKDISYVRDNEERNGGGEQNVSILTTENGETTIYTADENGEQVPFIKQKVLPSVQGVLVVSQGGNNEMVAKEMKEAIMALFGIDEHKIKVVKMKGEER